MNSPINMSNYSKNVSDNAIETLKNIPVSSIAEKFKLNLRKQGYGFVALCPFHNEKTPSFNLTDGKGFKCFGCGESGGSIKLFQKLSGIDNFRDAVIEMAYQFNVQLEYTDGNLEPERNYSENPKIKKSKKIETGVTVMNSENSVEFNFENFELGKLVNAETIKPRTREIQGGKEIRTIYQYTDSQWIERIERFDTNGNRIKFTLGKRQEAFKHIIPHYINEDGETVNAKGENIWPFYRQDEAIKVSKGKWILMPEGEKCVEVLRELGFIAVSRMGADKADAAVQRNFKTLKDNGIAGIVLISDNDDVGEQECEKFVNLCSELDLPAFSIKTFDFWQDALKNGDVADWVELFIKIGKDKLSEKIEVCVGKKMIKLRENSPKYKEKMHLEVASEKIEKVFLSEILTDSEKEIHLERIKEKYSIKTDIWKRLLTAKRKETNKTKFFLEIKALLQCESKIDQHYEMAMLAQSYRIPVSSIKEMMNSMKSQTSIPEFEVMSLDELFKMTSDGIDYLIPGLLPRGESVLLAAMPKVGKSLMGIDLAYCVATGEDYFLGEKCQTGKVLYVSVDESALSFRRKASKRNFRDFDKDNLKVITKFNIEHLSKLEKEIEDFRPVLVVIDSLKRITTGMEISENDAKFSEVVYEISELCSRYSASCVLIHHSKKNNETTGIENVRGSTAITGALGNVWILDRIGKTDPNNKKKIIFDPKDTRRKLYCYSRDNEGRSFDLELNPENNSYSVVSEDGKSPKEQAEHQTAKQRILHLLQINQQNNPDGVTGTFLFDCLEMTTPGKISKGYLYTTLNRLVDDKVISSKPAPGNKRYVLYSLPSATGKEGLKTEINNSVVDNENNSVPSPPLVNVEKDILEAETTDMTSLENTYHDTYHTPIIFDSNHPDINDDKCQNTYDLSVSSSHIINDTDKGGVGDIPENHALPDNVIDTEKNSHRSKEPKPVKHHKPELGSVYLDEKGLAHRIDNKTDKGWFDHEQQKVTPGICRDYQVFISGEYLSPEAKDLLSLIKYALANSQEGCYESFSPILCDDCLLSQLETFKELLLEYLNPAELQLIESAIKHFQEF